MQTASNLKSRVVLVGLEVDEFDLILKYHNHPDWEVAAFLSSPDTVWLTQLARSCGIPVVDSIDEILEIACERIVVGGRKSELQGQLSGMVGEDTEVCGPIGPEETSVPDDPSSAEETDPPLTLVSETPRQAAPQAHGPEFTPAPSSMAPSDPPEEAPMELEVAPQSAAPAPDRIDRPAATPETPDLSGLDLWNGLDDIRFDPVRGNLFEFMKVVCRRLKASSASLSVPGTDPRTVLLVAWQGLPEEITANPKKSADCMAGRAIREQKVQLVHTTQVPLAEDDSSPVETTGCSLPIVSRGRVLAALSFALPRREDINPDDLSGDLRDLVSATEFQLIRSLEIGVCGWFSRRQLLLHAVDRALCLNESFPERLRAVGDVLCSFFGGRMSHVYLADSLGERLQLISEPGGPGSLSLRSQKVENSMLGSIILTRSPCFLLPAPEEAAAAGSWPGMVMLPLASGRRAVGLVVIEGVHISRQEETEAYDVLRDVYNFIEETISAEHGIGDQNLYAELQMRFTEVIPALDLGNPMTRAQMALDAAVQTLAAEGAVWISPSFPSPVLPGKLTPTTMNCLTQLWPDLERLVEYVRAHGRAWSLADEPREGPELNIPYAAVSHSEADGVLILAFEGSQVERVMPQLTASTIMEILQTIAAHVEIPKTPTAGR
jgi:hypothetical protein